MLLIDHLCRFLQSVDASMKQSRNAGYHVVMLKADYSQWVEISRERTVLFCFLFLDYGYEVRSAVAKCWVIASCQAQLNTKGSAQM